MRKTTQHYCHCVIGVGRVGSALVATLQEAGASVVAVGVRHARPPETLPTVPHLPPMQAVDTALRDTRPAAIWLAVPDDAIEPVAEELCRHAAPGTLEHGSAVAIHLSGVGPLRLLDALKERAVTTLALHPLQSFGQGAGAEAFRDVPVAVTAANEGSAALGERFARLLGGRPFRLQDDDRVLYHVSAVMASNLLVALESVAADLLRQAADGSPRQALEMLQPLVETTLANVFRDGAARALTGPVARGDVGTLRSHLALLDHGDPVAARVYRDLSLEALRLAAPRLDDEAVRALRAILVASQSKPDGAPRGRGPASSGDGASGEAVR